MVCSIIFHNDWLGLPKRSNMSLEYQSKRSRSDGTWSKESNLICETLTPNPSLTYRRRHTSHHQSFVPIGVFLSTHCVRRKIIRPNPFILIGSIGIGKLHEIEKICGACQSKLTNGVCSTMDCMHQAMKVPSEDVVEIVSFNVKEQFRSLINNNLDLVKQYQQQARDQATCDPNDIVCAEVYQSILATHCDFFVSVVTHTDGILLYKSKNCSACYRVTYVGLLFRKFNSHWFLANQ